MAEEKTYYESEAKRKWQKENTVLIAVKLQKSTDKDILEYLADCRKKGITKSGVFKEALREKMQRETTGE